MNPKNYIEKNRTILFDWFVFSASFSLGFVFPDFIALIAHPLFSWMMLAALLLYIAGAWLKHLPLYFRLLRTGKKSREINYFLFLLIGHWIVLFAVILFSVPAMRKLTGLAPAAKQSPLAGTAIPLAMILAGLITWLVFHHKKRLRKEEHYPPSYLFRRELVADIFLVLSVTVFTFAFWEKGVMAMLLRNPATDLSHIWYLFFLLSIAYLLVYLPLRYLFLVEDHSHRQTWQRMLFFFGLLLIRSLFVMLDL